MHERTHKQDQSVHFLVSFVYVVLILDEKWKKSTNLLKTFTIFISTDDINDGIILCPSAPEKVCKCVDFSKNLEIGSTLY